MPIQSYLLTFNCARNLVSPDTLAPSLFDALPNAASVPDVVAISLQEVAPIAYSFLGGSYLKPYFDRVSTTVHLAAHLRSHGSERLEHIATRSLGMTALMIFARPRFAERIRWIQAAGAGVGFWNMGNKGAVALRLGVSCPDSDDTLNLSFTAAHLAPMEWDCEGRNKDWENIVRNMVFLNNDTSGYTSSEEVPLLASALDPPADNNGLFFPGSHLFLAGDLNYRTYDTPPGPEAYESYPQPVASESSAAHFSHLLKKDQLTREREANRTLHGLQEVPIDFPPTYKYSMRRQHREHKRSSSDVQEKYEWAKHRYPSWCDRILYLPAPPSSPRLEPQLYTALPVQPTSDHRPVVLSLRVDDRPLPQDAEDIRSRPPFPINPDWRARRDAARRWEVIVGILSYLALTKKGNAIIVAVGGMTFAGWYLAAWLSRG
ncbi:DNase I-like protein [Trematosphaeria pertusa]|uniref:DNase I-like protein n=1 Tax=Trematosphaeria pertusa TaxID=390896 RepID=A0A6A6IRG3_9PLEO|nr:DNase I-like protein [Trematosphaeria pertusa]KAF2252113.1 DNase I-like protein [Trematosphaeria pertusa]